MMSERCHCLFMKTYENKVPMVSKSNTFLGNGACQSHAVRQECHTQVYERTAVRSLADVNHTQV